MSQFGGRRVKLISMTDAMELFMILPGARVQKLRAKFGNVIQRYIDGEKSLMELRVDVDPALDEGNGSTVNSSKDRVDRQLEIDCVDAVRAPGTRRKRQATLRYFPSPPAVEAQRQGEEQVLPSCELSVVKAVRFDVEQHTASMLQTISSSQASMLKAMQDLVSAKDQVIAAREETIQAKDEVIRAKTAMNDVLKERLAEISGDLSFHLTGSRDNA